MYQHKTRCKLMLIVLIQLQSQTDFYKWNTHKTTKKSITLKLTTFIPCDLILFAWNSISFCSVNLALGTKEVSAVSCCLGRYYHHLFSCGTLVLTICCHMVFPGHKHIMCKWSPLSRKSLRPWWSSTQNPILALQLVAILGCMPIYVSAS